MLQRCSVVCLALFAGGDLDADKDGLTDFQELHKYLTDPKKADSDGDGIPDGDWEERREFTYSVRAVMHVMAPFDVASMNDDYQDVRVLEQRADLLEFEVVIYPFNTSAEAIPPNTNWRKTAAEMKEFVRPGVCSNWDKDLQARLTAELKEQGVELGSLDDVQVAQGVSDWLMKRSEFEDSFTTFAVEFEKGHARVAAGHEESVESTMARFGRTLEQQFDRELFGKGMFTNKIHGSCTSSAIYLSTGLKAAGLPTRTIVCTPIVDASDAREVAWIDACISHVGVRAKLKHAAEALGDSWASHTFNEVFVGGRWRRLNYTRLGQNVLDDGMGLFVHVHTFNDHSEAGLLGWGNRKVHPQHDALFGGPNPYSCLSLSDRFGVHAKVANELLVNVRELTIQRLAWYDAPDRPRELTTTLGELGSAGYVFAYLDMNGIDGHDALEFYLAADKHFALRARGRDDLPAKGIGKFWGDPGVFILRIAPGDFARMESGVEYELVWIGSHETLRWNVAKGAGIVRARR